MNACSDTTPKFLVMNDPVWCTVTIWDISPNNDDLSVSLKYMEMKFIFIPFWAITPRECRVNWLGSPGLIVTHLQYT